MKKLHKVLNSQRVIALVLSVAMLISLGMPFSAMALEEGASGTEVSDETLSSTGEDLDGAAETQPSDDKTDKAQADAAGSIPAAELEPAANGIAAEPTEESNAVKNEEDSAAVELAASGEETLEPYFDFDSYDWSDPAEYLNELAREKYKYWDKNANDGDKLFYNWNKPYYNDALDSKEMTGVNVSQITAKEYIKERVDEGAFPTDERFFGVWDENTQTWTTEPMIDYSVTNVYEPLLKNKLADVGEAAKAGDYVGAKEAYLAYYQNMQALNPLQKPSISSDMKNRSDMLMRNMYIHSSFPATGWFFMDQKEGEVTVDVTTAVESKRNGMGAIALVVPDKDEYQAEFWSKEKDEGKHAPYIEATVGGITMKFPVVEDAYVGGGAANGATPFGATDPERLLVSESEDTTEDHTAEDGFLIGENMRRTYLLFDFGSQIKEGDVITNATLHLYGKVNDMAEPKRNDPSYQKLIAVTGLSTDSFDEDNVVWLSDVLVNGVYSEQSRDPKQQSFFWGGLKDTYKVGDTTYTYPDSQKPNARMHEDPLRFSGWWDQLAQTYYSTGNEDYARTAMLILHDFIKVTFCLASGEQGTPARWMGVNNNGNTKGGHLLFGGYAKTLDMSQRSKIATNVQYLFNSEYMTPEIFVTFMKYIKVLGDKAVRDTWGSSENGNWGSMQVDGHSQIMFKYPELAYTKPNVDGGYLRNWVDAINLHATYGTAVFADGAGHELSQGYTHVALNRLLNVKRGADEVGFPFEFSDKAMDKIVGLAYFMFRTCLPGVKEAQYGDSNGHASYKNQAVQYVADLTQDPELLWIAYDGKKGGKKPDYTSYYYPVGKFFAMRNNWTDNALYLHTNADQADGAHSHWDDGGVIVSAYGNYLLADVGYLGYLATSLPHRWQVSSRGHNTVEINDYCQTSKSPNTMDYALVSKKVYDSASDKGSAKPSDGVGNYEMVVTGDGYDFSKLDLTHVYKNLGYLQDPVMAPGGSGETPPQEPGMTYKRNILFLKDGVDGFWIVSDYMNPVDQTKNNKYSQYWHMAPEANISIDGQYKLKPGETVQLTHSDFADVDKQIENTQYVPGTGTGAFKSNFNGKANIQVVPADIESVEPKLCYGYYTDGYSTPYGRFDKYAVGTTKFDTILFPTKTNEVYSVVPTPVPVEGLNENASDGSASAFTAEIKAEEAAVDEDYKINYMILHEPDKKAGDELAFSNLTTNGDLAFYQMSGNEKNPTPERLIFHNGTHLKNTALDYELAYSKGTETINEVSVKWSGSMLEIEAGKARGNNGEALDGDFDVEAFLKDFTVIAPHKITSVTVNGKKTDFKQKANYVYFGNEPILDGSDLPFSSDDKEDPAPTKKPGHGGSGGGGGGGGVGPSTPTQTPEPTTPVAKPSDKFKGELEGHWAQEELTYLVDNGIVNGSDGTLNLTGETTRAEFTKMILEAMDIQPVAYNGAFADVSANDWYAGYLQAAADAGIMQGFEGMANPNARVTREEAVKIMLTAMKAEPKESELNFADAGQVSDWARPYMGTAVAMGLIQGMEDNTLMPKSYTLREQAMVMVYRMLKTEG